MTGLFHVSPEATPVGFDAAGIRCTKVSVGTMDNNAYLLDTGSSLVLIDAADEAPRLIELIGGRKLAAVITTHRHHDHVRALADVVRHTGAQAWAGAPDEGAIAHQTAVHSAAVWSGDQIVAGDIGLDVIGLVGHTPGSIALVLRSDDPGVASHIFTGDSLFPGGIGATASASQFTSLLDGVIAEIFDRFDDDTLIHPGHGDSTTVGTQRPHLADWRARGW
ncbi:MBL fold metallo-hydrolase [Brooklawnia sp.]|uniref:MBL fold metallo-hydrolase n=1 Tax=Brooklawnia sp. TaxID=2699740 RepID=UPI00311DA62A